MSDAKGVRAFAEQTDAIVNCAVLRPDRRLAFDVNVLGTYNAVAAAVASNHRRFINTGPHFSIFGNTYEDFDFGLSGTGAAHCSTESFARVVPLAASLSKARLEQCSARIARWHHMLARPHAAEPSHPGVYLYAITKGIGQEICRVFAENNPQLTVIHLMYYHFKR